MRIAHVMILLALLAAPMVGRAQQPGPDPFAGNLFSPELVMQHQQEIGLTDQQRATITAEITKAQQRATEVAWKLQKELADLAALTKQDPVDEQAVLQVLERVLNAERDVKRAQVLLLVRIKNTLTPEQRARLKEFRDASAK